MAGYTCQSPMAPSASGTPQHIPANAIKPTGRNRFKEYFFISRITRKLLFYYSRPQKNKKPPPDYPFRRSALVVTSLSLPCHSPVTSKWPNRKFCLAYSIVLVTSLSLPFHSPVTSKWPNRKFLPRLKYRPCHFSVTPLSLPFHIRMAESQIFAPLIVSSLSLLCHSLVTFLNLLS